MSMFEPLTAAQLFQSMVEEYESEATTPAQSDTGSTMGAIFEAGTMLALQIQQQLVYLAALARLATSSGADVDSFVNPFGIYRLGTVSASGQVTVTYNSNLVQPITVVVGTIFQTPGGLLFTVIADPTNINYSQNANGYVINAGSNNTSVTVQCNQSGIIGNVPANSITLPYGGGQPLIGSPTLTNPAAFTNGTPGETDQALMLRFAQNNSGGGGGTINAIIAALQPAASNAGFGPITFSYGDQVQTEITGAEWNIVATNQPGYFTIVVNVAGTGTGAPQGLISAIQNALLNVVRPAGSQYNILAPNLLPVAWGGTIILQPGYSATSVQAAVQAAAATFTNNLGLDPYGNPTVLSLMSGYIVLSGVPGVLRIDGLTYNGGTADLNNPFGTQLVAGSMSGLTTG